MKILIIDDEYTALTKMKAMLQPYGQCEVATCGKQALKSIKKAIEKNDNFDLITIDIELPDIDGLTLLKQLNLLEINITKKSTKLMISASSTLDNVTRALQFHCDGFLVKPIRRAVLKEKLKSLQLID